MERTVQSDGTLVTDAWFAGPHLNGTPTTILTDADYFKSIFCDVEEFPKLPIVYEAFQKLVGEGLVTSSGETHKNQRKLLTPIFHFGRLKQMPDIMVSLK